MSTPPQLLSKILAVLVASTERVDDLIDLRAGGAQNQLEDRITLEKARAMAERGEIEGIGSRSGRLRYVRRLPEPIRLTLVPKPETFLSTSTVFARLNIGAYKQALRLAITDGDGVVTDEGEVCGHVWAHCGCRGVDNSEGIAA